jgi:hypothetical protein
VMKRSSVRAPDDQQRLLSLSNDQIVLLAVVQLGGTFKAIDPEDIAMAADKIAPGKFRWKKYPKQIDLELINNGLRDAKKRKWLVGSAPKGWCATEDGVQEAKKSQFEEGPPAFRPRLTSQQRSWITRERGRLLREDAFTKVKRGDVELVSEREVLKFFRIDEYVIGQSRQERVDRLLRSFENDKKLGAIIKILAEKVPR